MALIDDTNFVGECNVAGMGDGTTRSILNAKVAEVEREFLQKVFGDFGVQFINPNNSNVARFVNLTADYIKYAEVRYVYFYYMSDINEVSTRSGKASAKQENATKSSSGPAMVKAWNNMVKKLQLMYAHMATSGLYPEFEISSATPLYVKNNFGL